MRSALRLFAEALKRIITLSPIAPFRGGIVREIAPSDRSVLDVGCSEGKLGPIVKFFRRDVHLVGVDINPSIKGNPRYDGLVKCNVRYLPIRDRSFDTVVLIEVLEHLYHNDGYRLLERLEKIAMRRVIISTTVGYLRERNKNNPYMRHKSGWYPDEFRLRGYKIRGSVGPRILPKDFAYFLSFILPLGYLIPEFSYHMTCVLTVPMKADLKPKRKSRDSIGQQASLQLRRTVERKNSSTTALNSQMLGS